MRAKKEDIDCTIHNKPKICDVCTNFEIRIKKLKKLYDEHKKDEWFKDKHESTHESNDN